jgi:hypothetical protein
MFIEKKPIQIGSLLLTHKRCIANSFRFRFIIDDLTKSFSHVNNNVHKYKQYAGKNTIRHNLTHQIWQHIKITNIGSNKSNANYSSKNSSML